MAWTTGQNVILETETCYSCGVLFAMPQDFKKTRCQDQRSFYCPNGHSQAYCGETDAQKYKRYYEAEQRANATQREYRVAAERAQQKAEASLKRLKKRTAAGVCPCCNRTVGQLKAHMESKHKQFMELQGLAPRKQLAAGERQP